MSKLSYSEWLTALQSASTFDLYRLHLLIGDELDNPQRIMQIHRSLRIGQQLHYFDARSKQQHPCQVLELKQKNVLIRDLVDGKRYAVPPYMLNFEGKSVDVESNAQQSVDRHTLKVGDWVEFTSREGAPVAGRIIRLNTKTATLDSSEGKRWRVSYALLSRVYQGEAEVAESNGLDAPGRVLSRG